MSIGGDGNDCMEKGVQYSWQDPGPRASSKPAQNYGNVNRRRWNKLNNILIGGDGKKLIKSHD